MKVEKKHFKFDSERILDLYYRDVSRHPILTKEEELDLLVKAKNGDEVAISKIVLSNLRLVISFAIKFQRNTTDILDLINCGNFGLYEAIENFEIKKENRFSTYACWWIQKSIISYGYYSNDLIKRHSLYRKIQKYINSFHEENQIYPTIEQIAEKNKIGKKTLNVNLDLNSKISFDSENVESGISYHELIPDENNKEFSSDIDFDHLISNCGLNEKEKDIILNYYGFNGSDPARLRDLGEKYNVTKERIRQIKTNALKKIKKKLLSNRKKES